MKSLSILFIFYILPTPMFAEENAKGHVAFFMFIPETDKDYAALFEDYNYYYSNVLPWLVKNNYNHSIHSSVPFKINNTTFSKSKLNIDIGAILIKNDKSYKVIRGIITDIDFISEINDFYKNGT